MNAAWYALHVKSRFEKSVKTQLQQKGYETLLPMYTSTRMWSDRMKSLSLPLFSNYVFCCFSLDSRLPIMLTPGVNSIVGAGRSPVAIDKLEMASLRQLVKSGLNTQPWPYLHDGQRVYVVSGPLKGLAGIVVRSNGGQWLILSITLLMRSLSVKIDSRCVKPLETRVASHDGPPLPGTGLECTTRVRQPKLASKFRSGL
jgi:transcription antitermination factor NusG